MRPSAFSYQSSAVGRAPRLSVIPSPRRSAFGLVLTVVLGCSLVSSAISADDGARVVVVVANYLSLEDMVRPGPNVRMLFDGSAVGLMNTGTYRGTASEVRYLTLGAGVRVAGSGGVAVCCDAGERVGRERAADIYARQTGKPAHEDAVVCLGLSRILRANRWPAFRAESIGVLGTSFHAAGLRTAVIGNSDVPGVRERGAPFIAMDGDGLVDSGAVGTGVVRKSSNSACGLTDDVEAIIALARAYMDDHGLIVIELGDFNRIESVRPQLSESAYDLHKSASLANLDRLIVEIAPEIERRGAALIVCSPCRAQSETGPKSNLAPVAVFKPGGKAGLLISATTRTDGLISNADLAPTILRMAGLDVPNSMGGRPAGTVSEDTTFASLQRIERIAVRNCALRVPVLVSIAAVVFLCAVVAELVMRRGGSRHALRRLLGFVFLAALSMPASLLLAGSVGAVWKAGYLLALAGFSAAVLGFSYGVAEMVSRWSKRQFSSLAVLIAVTALLILGDVATGARLLRWSILTCSQIVGIRYYGLGNEYMGILVGASLLAPVLFLRQGLRTPASNPKSEMRNPRCQTGILLLWFAVVALVIGYPRLGANVGGTVVAIVTFGVALVALSGARFRFRHALVLLAVTCTAVAAFAAADVVNPAVRGSHLGRSVSLARMYGWEWLWYLIAQKVMLHIRILKLPQAYYPILFAAGFLYIYRRPTRAEGSRAEGSDILYTMAMPAVVAGMVVAFLFNDSGIVPAGLMLAMFMVSVLYLRLVES